MRKIQIFFIAAALAGTLLTMPTQAAGLTLTVA